MAQAVGCGGSEGIKECMASKSGADLIDAAADFDWGPTADGVFLPAPPKELLAAGKLNPGVSVLWGGNTNDSAMPYMLSHYVNQTEYIQELNQTLPRRLLVNLGKSVLSR